MKIKSISIQNFRCFKNMTINFVLVENLFGENVTY